MTYIIHEQYDSKNKKIPPTKKETKFSTLLKNKGIGTVDFANQTGLEYGQISNYKSGKQTNIMLDTAKKICNVLGTSLDETFGDGQVDFKTKLLADIEEKIKGLNERDAEGHLWYNKFKDIILSK